MNPKPSTCRIKFIVEAEGSKEISTDATAGEFLNQVAYRAGITIQQTCGGVPSCTDCKVVVKEGITEGFEPPAGPETRLLGNVYFITHERLSCQAVVKANSTVFVPTPRRRKEKSGAKKRGREISQNTGDLNHGQKEKGKKNN